MVTMERFIKVFMFLGAMVFQAASGFANSARDLASRISHAAGGHASNAYHAVGDGVSNAYHAAGDRVSGFLKERAARIAAEDAASFDPSRRAGLQIAGLTGTLWVLDSIVARALEAAGASAPDDPVVVGYYKVVSGQQAGEVRNVPEKVFNDYERLSEAVGNSGGPLSKEDLKYAKVLNKRLGREYSLIASAKIEKIKREGRDPDVVEVFQADVDEAKKYSDKVENKRYELEKLRYVDPAKPTAPLSRDDQDAMVAVESRHASKLQKNIEFHERMTSYLKFGPINVSQLETGVGYESRDPNVKKFSGREADLYVNALIHAKVLTSADDVGDGVPYTLTKAQADAFNAAVNPFGTGLPVLPALGDVDFEIQFNYITPSQANAYVNADTVVPMFDIPTETGHLNPAEAVRAAELLASNRAAGPVQAPSKRKIRKKKSQGPKFGESKVKRVWKGTGNLLKRAGRFANPFD